MKTEAIIDAANGLTHYRGVQSWEAPALLRELGIDYDLAIRPALEVPERPWAQPQVSPVTYFQRGGYDLAYTVDGIGLTIFHQPRKAT